MRIAASEARSFTRKPRSQLIDVTLDRACYAEMTAAREILLRILYRVVSVKEDTTNLLTAVRMLRMGSAALDFDRFKRMALPFAALKPEFFAPAFDTEAGSSDARETILYERLSATPYIKLKSSLLPAPDALPTLTEAELVCENYYLDYVRQTKRLLYGAEVIGAYITAREYEVKNLRIIAAGKLAGLPPETIKKGCAQLCIKSV